MEPISMAIDFLQADYILYGFLLPTLVTIKLKYKKMSTNECSVIKQNIIDERRFIDFFKLNKLAHYAILASVCHPEVKLKWFNVISQTIEMNKYEVHEIVISAMNAVEISENIHQENFVKKFVFLEYGTDATNSTATPSENELLSYLSDADTSLRNLKKFPRIYEVFMKYNTPITSSAPVERLFSMAGLLNTPRRNSMSDEHFEQLVILKTVFKQNSSIVLHSLN
ncbi:hypothetical protein CVS40_11963 [Lucilia cuprina]|nr:hypothetical protein CVS40_11963 [Lucilia cuprina]